MHKKYFNANGNCFIWLKQCVFVLKLVLRRSGSCKYVGLSEYQKRHQQQFSQTNSCLTNCAMAEVVSKMQKLKCTSLHIFEMIHVGVDSWDRPQQTKVTLSSRNGCMDWMSVWRRSTETDYRVFTWGHMFYSLRFQNKNWTQWWPWNTHAFYWQNWSSFLQRTNTQWNKV